MLWQIKIKDSFDRLVSLDILKEALFSFQLERDTFTSTPYEIALIVSASTNTELIYASMDWEEVSR